MIKNPPGMIKPNSSMKKGKELQMKPPKLAIDNQSKTDSKIHKKPPNL